MVTKLTGPQKTSKTRSITVRIPKDIAEDVERLSLETRQTVSNIVREELIKFVKWDVHESKIGLMPIPLKILDFLIAGKTDKEIKELASLSYELLKEWTLITKGSVGLNQCIESLEDFMSISNITSTHKKIVDEHTFEIRHNLSENWSLFGRLLFKNIFDDFSKKQYTFRHETGLLCIKNILGADFNEHEY